MANIKIEVDVPKDGLELNNLNNLVGTAFSCTLCHDQLFTNRMKLILHYGINHSLVICSMCNILFSSVHDKRVHELEDHYPFPCSYECSHEFHDHAEVGDHYRDNHQAKLCDFCPCVVEPIENYIDHLNKKHNIPTLPADSSKMFTTVNNNKFTCNFCFKTKKTSEFSGHYAFYHSLSVHFILQHTEPYSQELQIRGAQLTPLAPIEKEDRTQNCSVCDQKVQMGSQKLHDLFCAGQDICRLCDEIFELPAQLKEHHKESHKINFCKFGCDKKKMSIKEVSEHTKSVHDITECALCGIFNSSNNLNNHLKDMHNVDLQIFDKNKANRLFRNEAKKICCKFCNLDVSELMKNVEQYCDHFEQHHSMDRKGILRNLEKNPLLNTHLKERTIQANDELISNFTIIKADFNFEANVVKDFDTSCVYAIGLENFNDEIIDEIDTTAHRTDCEFCGAKMASAFCLYEHLKQKHNFKLLSVDPRCSSCKVTFSSRQTFIKHRKLKHTPVIMKCPFCTKEESKIMEYEQHLLQHSEVHIVKCNSESQNRQACQYCPMNFWTLSQKNIHQLEVHQHEVNEFLLVCPIDNTRFISKLYLQNHIENEHKTVMPDKKILYKCSKCYFVYPLIDDIRKHMSKAHPQSHTTYCKICKIRLSDDRQMQSHLLEKHAGKLNESQYSCNVCMKVCSKKSLALVHFKNHHQRKDSRFVQRGFKCLSCTQEFRTNDDRKLHYLTQHPDEKVFKCKECDSSFKTKGGLSTHRVTHKTLLNECHYCHKTFSRRDSFKEHLLIHEGIKHKCRYCDKSFVQRSNLVRHERIHTNSKPYQCQYCEKTFSDKGACTSHENVHTRVDVSECDYCGKSFSKKQKLKYHLRLHTQENLINCTICTKVFTHAYSFRKHMETHQTVRPNRCKVCLRILKSKQKMKEHLKEFHNMNMTDDEVDDDGMITTVTCTLCNSEDMTEEKMVEHLKNVHAINNLEDWKSYINEVEFQMEIDEIDEKPSTSKLNEVLLGNKA